MTTTQSGNLTHDITVAKSEAVRQAATIPGTSMANVRAANIAHYRACLASAVKNGINPSVFIAALQELGTGGV